MAVDTFDDCQAELTYDADSRESGDDGAAATTAPMRGSGDGTDGGDGGDGGSRDDGTEDTTDDGIDGGDSDDDVGELEEVAGQTITRLGGTTRIETAIEISREAFDSWDTVVLARSDLFPDALTGGPFAHAVDAPILLTPPDRLVPQTEEEIIRIGASELGLLGGTAPLSEDVANETNAIPEVTGMDRIGGSDPFGTARLIANRLLDETDGDTFETAYLAQGADPDPSRG